ncbi:hypothetical protein ACG2F4_05290 [Halalkalibaculum sp. DA3122]|uniref:hypothetical protein n=1 Tax=Halalkalibaculum sp. DA3122 TaxID=3373607 RepID=UPI003754F576
MESQSGNKISLSFEPSKNFFARFFALSPLLGMPWPSFIILFVRAWMERFGLLRVLALCLTGDIDID